MQNNDKKSEKQEEKMFESGAQATGCNIYYLFLNVLIFFEEA